MSRKRRNRAVVRKNNGDYRNMNEQELETSEKKQARVLRIIQSLIGKDKPYVAALALLSGTEEVTNPGVVQRSFQTLFSSHARMDDSIPLHLSLVRLHLAIARDLATRSGWTGEQFQQAVQEHLKSENFKPMWDYRSESGEHPATPGPDPA